MGFIKSVNSDKLVVACGNADDENSEDLTGLTWKECHDHLVMSALGAGEKSMCVTHLLTPHYRALPTGLSARRARPAELFLICLKIVSDFKELTAEQHQRVAVSDSSGCYELMGIQ